MKNINKYLEILHQYEILIVSGFVIFIIIILSGIFLIPNIAKVQEYTVKKTELEKKLTNLKRKDSILSNLDNQFYKDVYEKLNLILPPQKDYISLFTTLDAAGKKSGVLVTKADVTLGEISTMSARLQKAPGSMAYIIPITIQAEGDLASIQNFLQDINGQSSRIMTFDWIKWEKALSGKSIYQVTLDGQAYYYIPPKAIGSVDAPIPSLEKTTDELLTAIANAKTEPSLDLFGGKIPLGKKNLFD